MTKAGNISRAARELYISQPAISKAIGKLEGSLSLSLFARSSRGVQPTSEDKILFKHTREAFDALDRGEQELKQIRELDIGYLRAGMSGILCRYILLPYSKTPIDQYPHMEITIESQTTAQTLGRLEQQKIDLGLVAESSIHRDLTSIPVMDIQDTFATIPNYLKSLYLREGRNTSLSGTGNTMLLNTSNVTRHHVNEYVAKNNICLHQILEVTTMNLPTESVKIGLDTVCVIKELVQKKLDSDLPVEIFLYIPIRRRTIGFTYHPSSQAMALKTFLEFLY